MALVYHFHPKQDTLDLKSSMCRKVSQAAKNILKFDVTAKDLFESIPSHSRVPKYTRPPKPPQNHPSL